MRGAGVILIVLMAGCRFDLPSAGGDAPADSASDSSTDARPDGTPGAGYRKRIAIAAARVTGSQTAFPVWIAIAADADLMGRATANGADIHFTRPDGTPLAYQLQRWTSSTGRLEAWVRVDLDDGADTLLDLRYGDPGAAHAADPPSVFSSSFAAVWHLDDPLANTTVDDARNQRDGTAMGGLGTADQVAAQLGGGIDFDGNVNRIQFVNPYQGGGNHTISAWVFQRTGAGFDDIVTVGNSATNQSRWFRSHYLSGVSAGFFGNDLPGSVTDIDNAGWVLLHWTWDDQTRTSRVYRNGVQVDNRMLGAINTTGTVGHIGYAPDAWGPGGNTPCTLNGILDEVRLATVVRSAGWIATEHANQSAPQTFYSVGAEEKLP